MRIEPTSFTLPRHRLIEAGRNLLITYTSELGCPGLPYTELPDFVRVTQLGGLTLSFSKPTFYRGGDEFIDYTSGSLTLRVRRG